MWNSWRGGKANPADMVQTGIVDGSGNPYFKKVAPAAGEANRSVSHSLDTAVLEGRVTKLEGDVGTLKTQVGWLFVAGLGAIIMSYLLLSNKFEARFDVLDGHDREISRDIGEMKAENARSFAEILGKLDDDEPQRSPGEGQAGRVREGAGEGR